MGSQPARRLQGLHIHNMSTWNIFSNHGHVLLYLAREPDARLRDVAANVGITERAVQKIVRDMQDAGVLEVIKQGRRNAYRIDHSAALRHDLEAHCTVGRLIDLLVNEQPAARPAAKPALAVKPAPKPAAQALPAATPAPVPVATKPTRQAKPLPPDDESSADASTAEQGSLF